MKIIDAHWEKRNLGVDCQEIRFSPNDSIEDFYSMRSELTAGYQVARIPSGSTKLLLALQGQGFQTIETQLQLERSLRELIMPTWLQRFESKISMAGPTNKELDYIFEVINNGVFSTDRIALDPRFSIEKSSRRYSNWIQDEIASGSNCFIIKLNGTPLGFNVLKKIDNKKFNALFGALFPEAQMYPGVGGLLPYYHCYEAKVRGGEYIVVAVSSNNIQALRLNLSLGFEIKNIDYILVKHQ